MMWYNIPRAGREPVFHEVFDCMSIATKEILNARNRSPDRPFGNPRSLFCAHFVGKCSLKTEYSLPPIPWTVRIPRTRE